ncbi:NucA/NucB deoxyribonuclease domain-containing protein [Kitasatospora sp. NPDC059795]|uniref:NucA/NucB deoxyribonuclease domain-containing protein n=1 Tax=Kitasatospora sp. NPDC059795 TaxID=3346949 RepID=UPI00364FFD14
MFALTATTALTAAAPVSAEIRGTISIVSFSSPDPSITVEIGESISRVRERFSEAGAVEIGDVASPAAGIKPSPSIGESESSPQRVPNAVAGNTAGITGIVDFNACRAIPDAGIREGKITSRYDFCRYQTISSTAINTNGQVIGTISFLQTEVTTGSNGTRDVVSSVEISNIRYSGVYTAASEIQIYKLAGTGANDPECAVSGGTNPYTATAAQLQGNGFFGMNVTSPPTVGDGDDKIKVCNIQWFYKIFFPAGTTPTPWLSGGFSTVRFDSASYLPSKQGVVFSELTPTMTMSMSDARVKGVAQHINQAFTDPGSTLPVKSDNSPKVIPGSAQQGSTLSRLYSKANPVAAQAFADNRSAVSTACTPLPHAPLEQCDEFPFASTWEGAGVGNGNFSVKYVSATENSNAGYDLGNFYGSQRVLHNDKFKVLITP